MNRFDNLDCMIGMKEYEDNHFDLAIVDPPYGINAGITPNGYQLQKRKYLSKNWDNKTPDKKYFNELFRISKNQIISGGNYFPLPVCRCFVVWDKQNDGGTTSDCEYLWTSFVQPAKIFRFNRFKEWHYPDKTDGRIHPTQKPLKLYKWLLTKYAKEGDKILDTHVGSASSLIACEDMGFEYVGFELDEDYYNSAQKRLTQFRSQLKLAI